MEKKAGKLDRNQPAETSKVIIFDTINTTDFSMDKDFSVTYNNIIEVVEFVESSNFLKTDLDFYETFISRLQSNVLENRILQIEKRLGSQVEYKKTFSTEKILVKTRRDVFGYDNTKMKHEQEMLANLNTKSIIPIVDKFNVLQGQFYHDLNAYNNNNEFLLQEINDDNLLNLENSRLFVDSIQKIESFNINQTFYNLSNSTAIKLAKDQTNLYNSKNYAAQLIMDNSNSNRHTNGYNNMIKYDQMVVEKLYQISSNYSALRVGETNIGSIGGISTEASTSTDQVALAVLRLKAGGMLWNLGNTVDDVSEFLKKSGVSTNQIWNESLFEIGNKPSAVIESTVSQGKRKEFIELISESKDDDSFLEYYSKLGLSGYYYCKSESNIQDENCDSSELVGKSMQLLTSLLEKYKNDMSKKRQLSSRIYKMMTSSTKLQFQPNPKDYSLLGWVVGMDAFIPQLVAALNHHNAVIAENIYNLLLAMLNLSDELIDKSLIHLISTELSNAASLHYSNQSRWIRLLLDYIKTKDGYINVLNNTQTFVAESSKMMELEEEKIERLLVKYHQLLSSQPIPGKCMDTAKIYDAIEEQVKFILYGVGSDPNNESSTLKTKTLILKSNRNQTFTSKFGLRLLEAVHKSKENNDWNCDDGLGKLHSEIFTYINVNNNTEVKNLSNFLFSACWYSQQYMYITLPLDNSYNYYGADNLIRFCGVGKHVTIFPTKTRPKKITFFSIDGYQIEFILKGNEDLRADYSILSIWNLLNTELFSSPKQGFSTFGVLPMGRSGGYVEVIPDIFPLFDLYKSHYKTTGGSFLSPAKVHANVKSKLTNPNDLYSELANTCPDNLLLNHVLRMSKNLAHYYLSAKSLAISAGIISLFGYLVGLGDRHLDNILLLNNNQFVLIDLNVCFDKSGLLAVPETVPFRLTRNISHFIDSTFAKLYPRVMTKLLLSIRSNPNLGILVESFGLKCLEFDPLSDWLKMHSLKTTPNNTTDAFVTKNVDNFNLDDCKSFDELASAVRVYTRRLCLDKGTLASHLDHSNLIPLVPSILVNSGKASSPNTSSVSASPSPCSMNEPSSSLLLDDCLNFARLVGVSNTLRTGSKFKDLTLAIQHNSADNLVNVERIVENLISCATSEKNLVKMYAGWSFWF
ncbi:Serine/threonine-protein kinase smg-1 [Zancudomyces culisetae]|uniref:Serine/threonine-protein kinase smg-1 n=1 Tax=Zancudomyces culisetae TaxID=1213189 RepID=A0A1R1PS76_ZANCU|nr:Serine/threonine-protein kinase smg-1 [Zancudomyces culisetae]|eukprot:OMH83801.1 Serine/threonine-protein kinase smg-1 [Zancudomyces culisetae]